MNNKKKTTKKKMSNFKNGEIIKFRLDSGKIFETPFYGYSELIDALEPEKDEIIDVMEKFNLKEFKNGFKEYEKYIKFQKILDKLNENISNYWNPELNIEDEINELMEADLNDKVLKWLQIIDTEYSDNLKIIKLQYTKLRDINVHYFILEGEYTIYATLQIPRGFSPMVKILDDECFLKSETQGSRDKYNGKEKNNAEIYIGYSHILIDMMKEIIKYSEDEEYVKYWNESGDEIINILKKMNPKNPFLECIGYNEPEFIKEIREYISSGKKTSEGLTNNKILYYLSTDTIDEKFYNACISGHIEVLKWLYNNPFLNFKTKPKEIFEKDRLYEVYSIVLEKEYIEIAEFLENILDECKM